MGDIQKDIENKAEELKNSDEQHLGDAMDNDLQAGHAAEEPNAKQAGEDVQHGAEDISGR